jgi:hypothetical protein
MGNMLSICQEPEFVGVAAQLAWKNDGTTNNWRWKPNTSGSGRIYFVVYGCVEQFIFIGWHTTWPHSLASTCSFFLISAYYILGSLKIAYEYSNTNLSFNAFAQFLWLSCIMQRALFFHHKLSIAVKESRRVWIKAKHMRSLSTQTTPGQHSQSRN